MRNLGIGLVRQGKKVLIIDADAQGSLTASLGFRKPDKLTDTLATVMGKILRNVTVEADEGIIRHAIEYCFDCLDKNTTKVYNMKSYLLTTLYNAAATMDSYCVF